MPGAARGALALALAGACSACAASPAGGPVAPDQGAPADVDLALRLPRGARYVQDVESVQTVAVTEDGGETVIEQTFGMGLVYRIVDVDQAGAMQCRVAWDWTAIRQKGPSGEFEYDSRRPGVVVQPVARALACLVGNGFSMEVTAEGAVARVKGMDGILEEMIASVGESQETGLGEIREGLRAQFRDEAMRDTMENIFRSFPRHPVAVGEPWTVHLVQEWPVPLLVESTCRVLRVEGGKASVAVSSRVSSPENPEPRTFGYWRARMKISGTETGLLEVDLATGWTVSGEVDEKLAGMLVPLPEGTETRPPAPIRITGRTRFGMRR